MVIFPRPCNFLASNPKPSLRSVHCPYADHLRLRQYGTSIAAIIKQSINQITQNGLQTHANTRSAQQDANPKHIPSTPPRNLHCFQGQVESFALDHTPFSQLTILEHRRPNNPDRFPKIRARLLRPFPESRARHKRSRRRLQACPVCHKDSEGECGAGQAPGRGRAL
jgi:hypothetical protein